MSSTNGRLATTSARSASYVPSRSRTVARASRTSAGGSRQRRVLPTMLPPTVAVRRTAPVPTEAAARRSTSGTRSSTWCSSTAAPRVSPSTTVASGSRRRDIACSGKPSRCHWAHTSVAPPTGTAPSARHRRASDREVGKRNNTAIDLLSSAEGSTGAGRTTLDGEARTGTAFSAANRGRVQGSRPPGVLRSGTPCARPRVCPMVDARHTARCPPRSLVPEAETAC